MGIFQDFLDSRPPGLITDRIAVRELLELIDRGDVLAPTGFEDRTGWAILKVLGMTDLSVPPIQGVRLGHLPQDLDYGRLPISPDTALVIANQIAIDDSNAELEDDVRVHLNLEFTPPDLTSVARDGTRTFRTRWTTNNSGVTNDDQIRLPLISAGTYNFVVDWGDGSSDIITAWDQTEKTHTYAAEGTYDVQITGVIDSWAFINGGDSSKLILVSEWGPLALGNTAGHFYGCDNMIVTATDSPTVGTTLDQCFRDCTLFNGPMNQWDVSTCTDLDAVFRNCPNFNQPLDEWDVSSSTSFNATFRDASVFDQDISMWEMSQAISVPHMFRSAIAFNQPIGNWNITDNLITLSNTFSGASSFNQDLSSWDVSNVTLMVFTFNATAMDQDLSAWDVTALTDASSVFQSTTMSTANYSALLIAWEAQAVNDNVPFHGGAATYNASSSAARQRLIDDHTWTITDGGAA